MQNSGLGNAVNPLTSLTLCFGLPVLMLITLRADEPQHQLMGRVTPELLRLLEVDWEFWPDSPSELASTLQRARGRTSALLLRPGQLGAASCLASTASPPRQAAAGQPRPQPRVPRREFLQAVLSATHQDLVITTTGLTSRELASLGDRPNHFYMVGSMGCALSLGLGVALAHSRRVVVIDGDGALLMRLGALATAGFERPTNLVHVVLDNGQHESTGGQVTASAVADLGAVAAACGYLWVLGLAEPEALASWLAAREPGLTFLHCPILPGTPPLPRPSRGPLEVARQVQEFLRGC